ncbi:MAG: SRPBCC domain-containing protein [Bacillota bacterium]
MESDRVERDIFIAAPLQRVWSLVSEPGWWVEDGGPRSVQGEGSRVVVKLAVGTYLVRLERSEPQHYIAFRWASAFPGEEPVAGKSTLIEFTLAEEAGGTRLRVVESGFATLAAPAEVRRKEFEGNAHGWLEELGHAKQCAEGVRE